jgi:hypothetical protein
VVLLPYHAEGKGVSDPTELARIGYLENDRARDLLFDLVTALRLCHEGNVTAGTLISSSVNHESEWSFGGTEVWTLVSQRDFLHRDPKYVLHQSDVPQVNEFVSNLAKLHKLMKLDAIDVALRRFHSAYHGYIEDRLIDQMIAFEFLFITDDENGIKRNLALRTASLIGTNQRTRNSIIENMKYFYKLRSNIVHSIKAVTRDTLREIVPKSGNYLRCSIKRYIKLLNHHSFEETKNAIKRNANGNAYLFGGDRL